MNTSAQQGAVGPISAPGPVPHGSVPHGSASQGPASQGAAPHVLVLGFGPVAARLIEELTDVVREGSLRLTVIGSECLPAYQRIKIGDVSVGRANPEDLALTDAEELGRDGVDLRCGVTATALDASERTVTLDSGETLHYDRLVLATGAEAVMPTMSTEIRRGGAIDAELTTRTNRESGYPDGVMALRDMHDALRIAQVVTRRDPVVVLGGGVLGVEAALAIAEVGAPVTLMHRGTVPMGRQIDTDAGMLLRRQLMEAGVDVRSACDVHTVIADDGRLSGVRTSLGEKVPAALLITCCGVKPRDELAARAGLATAWGVVTDRSCRSVSDPQVFAVGDCAAVDGRDPSGLIAPGWAQAESVAAQIRTDLGLTPAGMEVDAAGVPVNLGPPPGGLDVVLVKSKTLNVACAGSTAVDPWDPESPTVSTWSDPKGGQYLRIVTEQASDGKTERLVGFVAVGMPRSAAELAMHCTRGTLPAMDKTALLAAEHATKEAELGPDDVLCRCSGATARQVKEAAACCSSVEEVGVACRAGTGCGTCHQRIEKVLEEVTAAPSRV